MAWDRNAILKGTLERLVLFTALLHGYPQMLIAFSAMKLGTRLHHDSQKLGLAEPVHSCRSQTRVGTGVPG